MALPSGATNSSGYAAGGSGNVTGISASEERGGRKDYWSLAKCKRAYTEYLSSKRAEIDEQQEARRYRHGAHWTAKQIEVLNKRRQPVVTYNRIGRKIDGIVGLVEKLRQDPKAFARTPQHEQGAELATAVLRYAFDQQDWKAKSPICAESGAIDGIGGIELELTEGDRGDREVGFEIVDIDGFFYDPRSFRADFSDARYMGMGKWVDVDTAKELFPDKEDEIDASVESGSELTSNSDRDDKWFSVDSADNKRIRLVDLWYRHKGGWCWCVFTGSLKLMEGKSYFHDEKNKDVCKYIVYSAAVDHDGDRYGFVRNLKSANDEVNQRRSKGLHELNSRRIIAEKGAFDNVERARTEAARPDGVVERNPGLQAEFDDTARIANIEGQLKFLEDAKAEIENFGPNPALIGTGVNAKSGRAIALMQEAGIAELGPYILAYRGWKLRVYRAVFNAIRENWTSERWIRVTDDDGVAQFVQINAMQPDPRTGQPSLVNAIGSLDVDIVLDEGPDTTTMMQDMYETLSNVVPSIAPMLQPAEARAVVKMLIETSPLAASQKKAFRDATQQGQQPDPMQQQAQQIQLAGAVAEVEEVKSKTALNMAKARSEGMPDVAGAPQPMEYEVPPELQNMQAMADIEETRASAAQKRAQAAKIETDRQLAPAQFAHEQRQDVQQQAHDQKLDRAQFQRDTREQEQARAERVAFKREDMKAAAEDRKIAARKPAPGKRS